MSVSNWTESWSSYKSLSDLVDVIGPTSTAISASISVTRHGTILGSAIFAHSVSTETLATVLETKESEPSSITVSVTSRWPDSSHSDHVSQISMLSISETSSNSNVSVSPRNKLSNWSNWFYWSYSLPLSNRVDIVGPSTTTISTSITVTDLVTVLGSAVSSNSVTAETFVTIL